MKTVVILFLIFLCVLGYVLLKYEASEHQKRSEGKLLVGEVRTSAPNCWSKTRLVIFHLGCSFLTAEIRTELAIILTSCICESKGIPGIVCENTKINFCYMNGNCLYECGTTYGKHVLEPKIGYNVFERMFQTVPLMCKHVLNSEEMR